MYLYAIMSRRSGRNPHGDGEDRKELLESRKFPLPIRKCVKNLCVRVHVFIVPTFAPTPPSLLDVRVVRRARVTHDSKSRDNGDCTRWLGRRIEHEADSNV